MTKVFSITNIINTAQKREGRTDFDARWRADIDADREAYRVVLAAQKSYLAHGTPSKPARAPVDRAGHVLNLLDKWHEALEDEGHGSPSPRPSPKLPSRFD